MRILLATPTRPRVELGVSQVALGLAQGLRELGVEVKVWSPPSARPRRIRPWALARRALADEIERTGPYDAVDLPAIFAGGRLARRARLVVRSVQPELDYLAADLAAQGRLLVRRPLSSAFHFVAGALAAAEILNGWRVARRIVCLGDHERRLMARRFPWLRRRLASYDIAPPEELRKALRTIRADRHSRSHERGVTFLWIGRWARHKAPERALAWFRGRHQYRPHDRLTVAGCGEGRDAAVREALGPASPACRIVPSYAHDELPGLLAEHDAGLFTSRVEGWGLSLQEMAESGMVVFATPTGAVETLSRFLGDRLRPFPPAPEDTLEPTSGVDWKAYESWFDWTEIARRYRDEVLTRANR